MTSCLQRDARCGVVSIMQGSCLGRVVFKEMRAVVWSQ